VLLALAKVDYLLALHAGIVEKRGALIALPANSGEGKSTLVAGLIKAGYRYLSDDLAPILRDTAHVVPVPVSICIKDSGFPVLKESYPEILQLPLMDRDDGRRAVYMPPPRGSIMPKGDSKPITHIVFPKYQEGADTRLTPLSRVAAFGRLLEQCVSIPSGLALEDAAMLVGWIEQVNCFDLVSGSLDSAIVAIDSLIDGSKPLPYRDRPSLLLDA